MGEGRGNSLRRLGIWKSGGRKVGDRCVIHFTRRMGRIVGGLRRRKMYEVFSHTCKNIRNVFFFSFVRGEVLFLRKRVSPLFFY